MGALGTFVMSESDSVAKSHTLVMVCVVGKSKLGWRSKKNAPSPWLGEEPLTHTDCFTISE